MGTGSVRRPGPVSRPEAQLGPDQEGQGAEEIGYAGDLLLLLACAGMPFSEIQVGRECSCLLPFIIGPLQMIFVYCVYVRAHDSASVESSGIATRSSSSPPMWVLGVG